MALTRALSPRIVECELTYLDRQPIDFALASAQHDAYERMLESRGCTIRRVEELPDCPDGVFVEDAAIALDELAVITRPGAPSRHGETGSVARALAPYRPLHHIAAPATIDGGDVLVAGHTIFAGRSGRTNGEGIAQLRDIVAAHGYAVVPVEFRGCLHLKSAVTLIGERTLLFNPDYVQPFAGFEMLAVDRNEPGAANALLLGGAVMIAAEHERTGAKLALRYDVVASPMSELLKAEAGMTCCSIIMELS